LFDLFPPANSLSFPFTSFLGFWWGRNEILVRLYVVTLSEHSKTLPDKMMTASSTIAISAKAECEAETSLEISNLNTPSSVEMAASKRTSTDNSGEPSTLNPSKEQQQQQQENDDDVSFSEEESKENNSIRKRLGCGRMENDMIESSDEEDDDEDDEQLGRRKLFFTSPRLMEPDESLFPVNHSPYKNSHQRWQLVSDQAGSHRQDGTVLMIGRKITPMALRIGITQQAAKRVRSLNLWLDHHKDTLPEWLDVIGAVFGNLEHLTLTEDVFPGEDEMAVSARMRRLYVLYRLPYLKSIDEMVVTGEERRMARPNERDPNGDRVVRKALSSLLDNDDDDDDDGHEGHTCNYPAKQDGHQIGRLLQRQPTHEPLQIQQQHLAHEMPVEIIHDKFSHDVVNDGVYGDENDILGQIPSIPATMSNLSTRTAKEVGVEINQELAAKFAELNRITTATTATTSSETTGPDFDDILDDELAGEAMLSDLAASSEEFVGSRSHFSESLSKSLSGEGEANNDDLPLVSVTSHETNSTHHGDAVEVDLAGIFKLGKGVDRDYLIEVPSQDVDGVSPVNGVASHLLDTVESGIELVSVASTDLEWTAACGVLSFRSDRTCAPRLRMPFARNRKVIAAEEALAAIRQAKINVRNKRRESQSDSGKHCTPVERNDTSNTPQVGCCSFGSSQAKFFPNHVTTTQSNNSNHDNSSLLSANQQLPPSKSLSSPFPMQFRERQKTPHNTNLVVQTSESTDSGKSRISLDDTKETISSPLHAINSVSSSSPRSREQKKILRAGKGDLPPPCPTGSRRKVPVPTCHTRKSKRKHRNLKSSKENARSTSVMDLEDEDDEEEEVEEDGTLLFTDSGNDEDSLSYSEAP
jgi:hypothetical protein